MAVKAVRIAVDLIIAPTKENRQLKISSRVCRLANPFGLDKQEISDRVG